MEVSKDISKQAGSLLLIFRVELLTSIFSMLPCDFCKNIYFGKSYFRKVFLV